MSIFRVALMSSTLAAAFVLFAAMSVASPGGATTAPAMGQRVKLWDKTPLLAEGPDTDTDPLEPTIDVYLPPADRVPPGGAGAVVVLPGGGYVNLSMVKEGSNVARAFLGQNMAAFVVRYRHAPRYKHPVPLMDAQRAMRMVRARAIEYRVNPDKIGILGFSAGGHLAASVTTMWESGPKAESPDAIDAVSAKANFAILMYPVINLTEDSVTHRGSRTSLTGDDRGLWAALSPERLVTRETPPVFIVHGTNDRTVPVANALMMYEACLKAGVPAEMHIFENGPHGFGLGPSDPVLREWPEMAFKWLIRRGVLARE